MNNILLKADHQQRKAKVKEKAKEKNTKYFLQECIT
jgi:hypothetical protein